MQSEVVRELAETLTLGSLLDEVRRRFGGYDLVDHWQQGEFHHDTILKVPSAVLVVATNCNGGVKEVLSFAEMPARGALWHWRCPEVHEFQGELAPILGRAVTEHWFDPCVLLAPDARSELLPEARERQEGGGWRMAKPSCGAKRN